MKCFSLVLFLYSCGNNNKSIPSEPADKIIFEEIDSFTGRWQQERFPLILNLDPQLDSRKKEIFDVLQIWNDVCPYMNFFEQGTQETNTINITKNNLDVYFKNIGQTDENKNHITIHYVENWILNGFEPNILGSIYIKYKKIKNAKHLLIEKSLIILNGSAIKIDLPSIILHEVGHLLGLEHEANSLAVMYAYLKSGEKKYTPIDVEIDALNDLYADYYTDNQKSHFSDIPTSEEIYSEEDYYGVTHIKIL